MPGNENKKEGDTVYILIYPFIVISISAIIYLFLLPISFFHYQKLKKQNDDKDHIEDDDLEDVL